MELSSTEWLSQPEMQDPTSMKQYGMGSFDCSLDELNFQSVSAESYSSYPDLNPKSTYDYNGLAIENTRITGLKRPAKQLKTSSWNSCTTDRITSMAASSSSSQIICFENPSSAPPNSHQIYGLDCTVKAKNEALSDRNMNFPTSISESSFEMQNCTPAHDRVPDTTTRTSLRAQDHVMAERKRREKLSQRFIALSTILPSLKKMDKASVLGDAIKYLKQLQERVNILEEQAAKKTMESVIFVKKTRLSADDGTSSDDENSELQLPEIEARVSDKNVLLKVHCEKSKGCTSKILSEIEKLDLNIVNSSIFAFGNSTLDITVVAQMDVEFRMTPKDLVRNLRQALKGLMK